MVVLVDQNVCTFDVPVHNVQVVESLQTRKSLDEHAPNFLLFEVRAAFVVLVDHLEYIPLFSILHDHAQGL